MIDLTAEIDNQEILRRLKQIQQTAKEVTSNVVTDSDRMDIAMRRFTSTLAKVGAGFSLASLVQQIARTRGEFQQLEVAFTTLLQSKEKADALMSQMVDLAAKTPFDLQGVADGARQLLAYGFAAEDITDTLTRLGNVAAGLGLPLERLTYLYGTTAVQGRLYARDMLQFTSSGIPMLQEMAKMYGVTTEEINAMVTAGKIGFEDVKKVIESMTNQGGQFYNLMENQSKTITGLISNLGDAIDTMFNDIGKSNQGVITNVLQGTISLVENYQKVLDILIPLIATYGTYKAVLILTAVSQQAVASAGNVKAFFELAKSIRSAKDAMLLLNIATKANPLGLILGAISGVIAAVSVFSKKTDEATRSIGEQEQAVVSEGKRINELASQLANANTKTEECKKIIQEIQNIQPKIVEGLDAESVAYKTLTDRLVKYNDEQVKRVALAKLQDDVGDVVTRENDANARKALAESNAQTQIKAFQQQVLRGDIFETNTNRSERSIQKINEEITKIITSGKDARAQITEIMGLHQVSGAKTFGYKFDTSSLKNALKEITEIDKELIGLGDEAAQKQAKVDAFMQNFSQYFTGKGQSGSDNNTQSLTKLSELLSNIQAKETELKQLQGKSSWTDQEKEKITSLSDELKKLHAQYKTLTGTEYGKTGSGASKALEQQQKLSESLLQAEIDLQSKRIALMREGKNKRLAEIDLEYQQTVAKINKEKQTAISGGATEDQLGKYDSLIDIAGNKRVQDRAQVEKDYALQTAETYRQLGDVFMSEEERKQRATEQTYQAMRDKAVEYLQAGNISGADFISMNDKIDRAEEQETAQNQLEKWQKYATERLRIEEEFQQDVARIRNQGRGKEGEDEIEQLRTIRDNDITALTEDMGMKEEEFTAIVDNIVNMGLDKILEMIPQVQNAINNLGDDVDPSVKAQWQAQLTALKAQAKNKKTGTESSDTAKESTDDWKDLQEVLNGVSETFNEVGDAIGGTTGEIVSGIGGIATATASMLNGIQEVKTASSALETASAYLMIISAALQVATKIASLFTKDHELSEETIKSYEAYIDVLDQIIEREKEVIESHTGMQAVLASDDAVKAIEKQEEATRKLGKAYLASRAKNNHSYGVKTAERLGGYQDAIEAAGFDWSDLFGSGRMEGLFDLSGEEIERFQKDLPEVWAQLDEDTRKYLETIVDCKDKMDELGEATSEALTGFTLDDARSELEDFLNDMDMTFEDVADNFEDIMMSAINRVITSQLDGRLQTWYENFSKAMEDGVLSETERDALKNEYESIYTDALQKREQAYALAGIDENALNNEQNASSRGFETMSQDTGTELNGRFTAIQEYTAGLLRSVEEMTSIHSEQNNNLIDIRDIMIQLNGNVADIRGYCKVLPNMADSMASMKRILNDKL